MDDSVRKAVVNCRRDMGWKTSVAPPCFWIVSVNIVEHSVVHLMRHEDTGCIMKTNLPRLESPLELIDRNASQEPYNFSSALSSVGGRKQNHTELCQGFKEAGHDRGLVLGKVDGNDEGLVSGYIFVVRLKMTLYQALQSRAHPDLKAALTVFPSDTNSKWKITRT
ncbi:hypothetical protein J6590_096749 [Homalodisca vitripennis]|nr:hypothetical protein J6590_096749 [Homalodisca vitripennis]